MGNMDISRLEEKKKRKKEDEESEQDSEIKTQAQITLGSIKNKENISSCRILFNLLTITSFLLS